MSVRTTIDPFNGVNFQTWKFRMESLLSEYDCLECVQNKMSTKPNKQLDEKMIKRDAKARNCIVQNLADSHLNTVRGCTTAYEMWKTLSETYERKGLCGKIMLKKKLLEKDDPRGNYSRIQSKI
uniref:Copia protein n=1 Tax=Cacopsylla melanoneura TaxID=428564 RepID=A0A8D8ZCS3_9HEMI